MTLSVAQEKNYRKDCQSAVDAMARCHNNYSQAAKSLGWPETSLKQRLRGAARRKIESKVKIAPEKPLKPLLDGRAAVFTFQRAARPAVGRIKRYILTSAQNNTPVNTPMWTGLLAFAKHIDARIMVSRYTYNKGAYQSYGGHAQKPGTARVADYDGMWFDPVLTPYLSDERVEIAPGLMWCGEANILPTAHKPLSGFESYTGRHSGIFPHAKIAMESVASAKFEATKFNYTTGTVTLRNYIQRKSGLKAEFHHSYGALLVEVDHHGNWYCRQINADTSGVFYDLDVKVSGARVTTKHRSAGIGWGDVHVAQIDPDVRRMAWGKGGMLDTLRPHRQFFHDILDMLARGHHNMRDPHVLYRLHVRGQESVADELDGVADFLTYSHRPWAESIVVDSNHHDHLLRWLKESDPRRDPLNAEFFHEAQSRVLRAIRENDSKFSLLEWAVRRRGVAAAVKFLGQDESYIMCPDAGDGIESGMHGHYGVNGARPSPAALMRMGRKANIGHHHAAGIYDGVYVAGTSSLFDLGYNKGPSTWSHSHILTYPNGKRAIITMWNGKWKAS